MIACMGAGDMHCSVMPLSWAANGATADPLWSMSCLHLPLRFDHVPYNPSEALRFNRPCAWPAVVFRMHYTELLSKDEEIAKLQAVIQALSGK